MRNTNTNKMHATEPKGLTPYAVHNKTQPFAKDLSFFVLTLAGFAAMMAMLMMTG